jgi:CMP-N,N'-diacetyllegionaminic acid synthase
MKILYLILARKGSKRLKNKNLLKINKKTLIELTINFVKKVAPIKNIIFSTDSKKMLNIANKLGINTPWLRPKKFSLDKSTSFDASLHAIKWFESKFFKIDAIALFQPTSPFRSKDHFIKALKKFKNNPKVPLVSIKKIGLSSNKIFKKKKKFLINYSKSKKGIDVFMPTGSFYLIKKTTLIKNKDFYTDKMNYFQIDDRLMNIDIDTSDDYLMAKKIFSSK